MESSRDLEWTRFALPPDRSLPHVCPNCLAPGARVVPLDTAPRGGATSLTAHSCELCADALDAARTRALARLIASTLLGVATATALAFAWGTRAIFFQLALSLLAASILPLARHAWKRAPDAPTSSLFVLDETKRVFTARRRDYARLAGEALTAHPPPTKRIGRAPLGPVLFTLVWALALQELGRSEVWVLSPHSDVVLLVDDRKIGDVPPTLEESPRGGRLDSWLGGRHHFALVGKDGVVHVEATAVLKPRTSYVFGQLPPGKCLLLESQSYGEKGTERTRAALRSGSALREVTAPVDTWFAALPDPAASSTSGGTRRAVRLLPCPTHR